MCQRFSMPSISTFHVKYLYLILLLYVMTYVWFTGAAGYDGANQLQHVVDARKSVPAMKDLLALEQVASVVHLDVLAHIAGQYENAATLKPAVAYQPPPRPTLGYVTTGKVGKRYRKMKNGK